MNCIYSIALDIQKSRMTTTSLLDYWKSRENVLQMLTDRKYNVKNVKPMAKNFAAFEEMYKDSDDATMSEVINFDTKEAKIRWHNSKIGAPVVNNYYKEMEEKKYTHVIIICDSITSHAKNAIRNVKIQGFDLETIKFSETLYNPTKNVYVPKHELLTSAERAELLEKYAVKPEQNPQMLSSDVIARYFHARKGDAFRITRKSCNDPSKSTISYRFVV